MGAEADLELAGRGLLQRNGIQAAPGRGHAVDGHQVFRPHFIQLPVGQGYVQGERLRTTDGVLQFRLQPHLVGLDPQ